VTPAATERSHVFFTDIADLLNGSGALWTLDAILKVTLVLGAGGIVTLVLNRASAASRHLIWTVALVSALALPALSIGLPRWQMPLVTLPQSPVLSRLSTELGATLSSSKDPQSSVIDRQVPVQDFASAPPMRSNPSAGPSDDTRAAAPVAQRGARGRSVESSQRSFVPWSTLVVAVWIAGLMVIAGRLLIGLAAVEWIARRTPRVADALAAPGPRTGLELGITRHVRFLRSPRATMPMAWGLLKPSVVMPHTADAWPAERLRIVLLHELAHVKRRDCLVHAVAQFACALHWFNPMAWVAARRLRIERERACDDPVLASGTPGADYAAELLEIARVMRGPLPSVLAERRSPWRIARNSRAG
jgi:beta-lactamase regulating signal transducer with metallopeptidase domain